MGKQGGSMFRFIGGFMFVWSLCQMAEALQREEEMRRSRAAAQNASWSKSTALMCVPQPTAEQVREQGMRLDAWRLYQSMRQLLNDMAQDEETTDGDWIDHLQVFRMLDQDVAPKLVGYGGYGSLENLAIEQIRDEGIRAFCRQDQKSAC